MRCFAYRGAKTREISFPLGGIGSGCIGLSGTGHLVDWELFNRPAKGSRNGFSHFAVKAERKGALLDARVLHADVSPPFAGVGTGRFAGFGFSVARETLSGLPHFRRTEFRGGFPLAEIRFRDPAFPGTVSLEAFNPFIPLNDKDSSLPAAFFTVTIRNTTREPLDYTVGFTVRNPAHGATTNSLWCEQGLHLLRMTGGADAAAMDFSDFAFGTDAGEVSAQEYWYRGGWFDNLGVYWQNFTAPGALRPRHYPVAGSGDHGTLAARKRVGPGASVTVRFIFAWNVPNCHNYWKKKQREGCDGGGKVTKPQTWKNYYATLFPDAAASESTSKIETCSSPSRKMPPYHAPTGARSTGS